MLKFLSFVILLVNISCGISKVSHQSESSVFVADSKQALQCELRWNQSWLEMQGASLGDMKQNKIEYLKTFSLNPNADFKTLEFTPTTMKSGEFDISFSPNINNFRIQLSKVTDEDQYRQLGIDPEKEVVLSTNMLVVVRDNQRNSHLNSTHFYEKDDDKLRWVQQYAFGPERKETGLAQSSIDDFEEPSVFDKTSPSVQVSLICKETENK